MIGAMLGVLLLLAVLALPGAGVVLGFWTANYSYGAAQAREGRQLYENTLKHPDFIARAAIRGYNSVKEIEKETE